MFGYLRLLRYKSLCTGMLRDMADPINATWSDHRQELWRDPYVIGFFEGTCNGLLGTAYRSYEIDRSPTAALPKDLDRELRERFFVACYSKANRTISAAETMDLKRALRSDRVRTNEFVEGLLDGGSILGFFSFGDLTQLSHLRQKVDEQYDRSEKRMREMAKLLGKEYDPASYYRVAALDVTLHGRIELRFGKGHMTI